jgi:myo-inositol-1(or 4)-monophosphatase
VADEQADLTDVDALVAAAAQAVDVAASMASSRTPRKLEFKGDRDMVSDVDIDIERAVRAYLSEKTPHVAFLGEEEGLSGELSSLRWTLDPIDGTANFVAGVPLFAIALALVDGRHSLAGIIDIPPMKERYVAIRGRGATLNGHPVGVRSTEKLNDAVVARNRRRPLPAGVIGTTGGI